MLSGGEALGAYQAGAYAALEKSGVRPNWIAGTAIGAVNAAIIAGNLPHERVLRMRQFWHEVSQPGGAALSPQARTVGAENGGPPYLPFAPRRRVDAA